MKHQRGSFTTDILWAVLLSSPLWFAFFLLVVVPWCERVMAPLTQRAMP